MLRRLNIDVTAHHHASGRVEPKAIYLYKQELWIPIEQILDVQQAANRKVGGQGTRYRCVTLEGFVNGAPARVHRTLWREGDQWFVEEKVEEGA